MLFQILSNLKGCQFAHIITLTEVKKIPKKWGIVGKVTKRSDKMVQLNYTYENAVNNRLEAQGDARTFVALPLRWGAWEVHNKVITYKGARYMRYYETRNNNAHITYYVNGVEATAAEVAIIKAYEASRNNRSERQSAEGLTTNQVEPRAVGFENVEYLKVGGQIYIKPQPSTLSLVG